LQFCLNLSQFYSYHFFQILYNFYLKWPRVSCYSLCSIFSFLEVGYFKFLDLNSDLISFSTFDLTNSFYWLEFLKRISLFKNYLLFPEGEWSILPAFLFFSKNVFISRIYSEFTNGYWLYVLLFSFLFDPKEVFIKKFYLRSFLDRRNLTIQFSFKLGTVSWKFINSLNLIILTFSRNKLIFFFWYICIF
jgi:hypothetical protein